MKISVLAALVLSGSLAFAAQTKGPSAKSVAAAMADSPHATVDGCLHQPTSGKFVVVRASGKKYYLTGKSAALIGLVNKEVRVYGALAPYEDASAPKFGTSYAKANAEPPERIIIDNIHKIDDSCANGSAGPQNVPVVVGSGSD